MATSAQESWVPSKLQPRTVNTADGGGHLRNSRPRTQAWARSGAAGGLPWGPSVAGGSCGHPATDGTSLHRAKREGQAGDTRLAEGRGLDPVTGLGASPGAAAAAGGSQAPSPDLLTFALVYSLLRSYFISLQTKQKGQTNYHYFRFISKHDG